MNTRCRKLYWNDTCSQILKQNRRITLTRYIMFLILTDQ